MKNNLFYIFGGLAMVLSSCNSFLDESPSDKLPSSSAITTVTDLSNAVNGVYEDLVVGPSGASAEYGLAGDMTFYGDLKANDAYTDPNFDNNHISPLYRYENNATSGHTEAFYQVLYETLGQVNDVLNTSGSLSISTSDKDTYNDLVGQLHALRGYLHFQAAILYAQIPTVSGADVTKANSGVPISDKVFSVSYKPSRSTLKETYDFIISEFTQSISLLSTSKNDGKINKWAAEALLSRVYLYYGDYSNALKYAQDVISNASDNRLYTKSEYVGAWKQAYSVESLFELSTSDTYNADRTSLGYYTDPTGYGEVAAPSTFYDFMQSDLNDIRSSLIVLKTNEGVSAYYTNKYAGQTGAISPLYVNNPKIIRLSEVYLIAAESVLKGGTATGAQSAVWYYNELRKNRISNYTDASSVSLNDILTERRKELNFEGQRLFDLVRNNISFENGAIGEVTPTDYRVIMAIPQREIDIAGSSVLVQNPGY
jgi:starch-binding outer membrane protein, SusD/RagB family